MKVYVGKYDKTARLTEYNVDSFKDLYETFIAEPLKGEKGGHYITTASKIEITKATDNPKDFRNTDHFRRNNLTHMASWGVFIDGDKSESSEDTCIDLELVHKALKKHNYNHFIYTTSSYIPNEKIRWRLAVSCPIKSDPFSIHKNVVSSIYKLLKNNGCEDLKTSTESFTLSQMWFLPAVKDPGISPYLSYSYFAGIDYPIPASEGINIAGESAISQRSNTNDPNSNSNTQLDLAMNIALGQSPLHSSISDWIWGSAKDGRGRSAMIADLTAMTIGWKSPEVTETHLKYRDEIPRWVDAGLAKVAAEAQERELSRPKPLPDPEEMLSYVPFPTEILPPSFLKAAGEIAKFNLCAVDDIVPGMLSVITMAISRKARIYLGSSSLPSFFHLGIINVAESGRFKSTIYDQQIEGIKQAELEMIKTFNKGEAVIKLKERALEKSMKDMEKTASEGKDAGEIMRKANLAGPLAEKLNEIKSRRRPGFFVDDVTVERAIEKAFLSGGSIHYFADEGQSLFASMSGKYNSNKATTDFLIRSLTGSTYNYDRKSSEMMYFRPVSSMNVSVQPDVYRNQFLFNSEIRSSGLAARLLIVDWRKPEYENTAKTCENDSLDEDAMQEYWDVTKNLAIFDERNVPWWNEVEMDDSHNLQMVRPVTEITIPTEFKENCNELFNKYWKQYGKGGKLEGKQESLNKCLSISYIMSGALLAYENYNSFYTTRSWAIDHEFIKRTELIMEYLIQKKSSEHNAQVSAIKVKGALFVLKRLTSNANIKNSLEGIAPSVFHRMLNYNRSPNQEMIDEGERMLCDLGYLKYDNGQLKLHPDWHYDGLDEQLKTV